MWLHYAAIVASVLVCSSQARAPELGAVEITPKFGPSQPLSIEVRNLSKLPVRLRGATLQFAASGSASPCFLKLVKPVSIPPASMANVNLAENRDVLDCVQRAGRVPVSRLGGISALSERELAAARAARLSQPVDVTVTFEVGKHPATSSVRWEFRPE
jgi:hypothetical protein